jgi:hypothetical protein
MRSGFFTILSSTSGITNATLDMHFAAGQHRDTECDRFLLSGIPVISRAKQDWSHGKRWAMPVIMFLPKYLTISINTSRSSFTADSALFFHSSYFKKPVTRNSDRPGFRFCRKGKICISQVCYRYSKIFDKESVQGY